MKNNELATKYAKKWIKKLKKDGTIPSENKIGFSRENKLNMVCFLIYSLVYNITIWGIFGYAVFILNRSGWWMILACFLSILQLRPSNFGISEGEQNE